MCRPASRSARPLFRGFLPTAFCRGGAATTRALWERRTPTEPGRLFFVDGLLEVGNLAEEERHSIESMCAARGKSLPQALEEATLALSGLSHCAGLVVVPKQDRPLKHLEFVPLGPGRALVVMVTEDGLVENRVIEVRLGLPPSALISATNFLNARLIGRTI